MKGRVEGGGGREGEDTSRVVFVGECVGVWVCGCVWVWVCECVWACVC